jgi:phosphatidylglycerophosphate synthase
MLDRIIRALVDPVLDRIGTAIARKGASADYVTLLGLLSGLAAAIAVAFGQFSTGFAFFAINRILDGIDGAVARASHATDRGGFIDIVSDFCVYGAIPLAFAYQAPVENAFPAAVLLFCFYINGASFLAFAAIEAKHSTTGYQIEKKSIHYSPGLMEGTETIIIFGLMLSVPDRFVLLAYIFSVLTFLTALLRCNVAWKTFHRRD